MIKISCHVGESDENTGGGNLLRGGVDRLMWYLKTCGWDCEGLLDKKSEYKMIGFRHVSRGLVALPRCRRKHMLFLGAARTKSSERSLPRVSERRRGAP